MYFFHIHPLIIEKVFDTLGNLHVEPPLFVGQGNVLTPIRKSAIVHDTKNIDKNKSDRKHFLSMQECVKGD